MIIFACIFWKLKVCFYIKMKQQFFFWNTNFHITYVRFHADLITQIKLNLVLENFVLVILVHFSYSQSPDRFLTELYLWSIMFIFFSVVFKSHKLKQWIFIPIHHIILMRFEFIKIFVSKNTNNTDLFNFFLTL